MKYKLKKMANFIKAIEYGINKEIQNNYNIVDEEINEQGERIGILEIQEMKVFAHALSFLHGKGDAGLLRLCIQSELKDQKITKAI